MKKLILGTTLSAAIITSVFAQGEVLFNNSSPFEVSIELGDGSATVTPANDGTPATTFYYALFFSPTDSTVLGSSAAQMPTVDGFGSYAFEDPNWTLGSTANGPAYGINTTAGKFDSTVADTADITELNNANIGSADYFTVFGWSASIGSNIAAVESFFAGNDPGVTSGYFGESDVSSLLTTGIAGSSAPTPIFGTRTGLDNPFVMGAPIIPEPTTLALSAMGTPFFLAFRRKKA